jgi:GDP/UDP-N,N'-diacetylbacillosamine 2-epimerase (hydrolysing)
MKIFLVTSTRADFGLLKNLILEFKKNNNFDLKIIATGAHFSKKHGLSYREINNEKIKIYKKILIPNNVNSAKNILNDMSIITKNISSLIIKDKPDLFIVLGDRYEILAVSLAAYLAKVPIAHIHGGEITQGSLDDGFRHCISKMSNIHFVSHDDYKKRLMRMGENPKNIYNVGGLGAFNIEQLKFFSKKKLKELLGINLKKKILLICLHPELNKKLTVNLANETLKALKNHKDKTLIFTMPGVDLYNEIIFKKIRFFVRNNNNSYYFRSLGSKIFLSLLNISDGIIGNSSSGILEMPSFKKPTINIGLRQWGRVRAMSVIDISPKANLISKTINFIYSKKFFKIQKHSLNPFKKNNTIKKIILILKKINLANFKFKKFYDILD